MNTPEEINIKIYDGKTIKTDNLWKWKFHSQVFLSFPKGANALLCVVFSWWWWGNREHIASARASLVVIIMMIRFFPTYIETSAAAAAAWCVNFRYIYKFSLSFLLTRSVRSHCDREKLIFLPPAGLTAQHQHCCSVWWKQVVKLSRR